MNEENNVRIGVSIPLPNNGKPCILRYREARMFLELFENAFSDLDMTDKERKQIDKAIWKIRGKLYETHRTLGGEGLPLRLSEIWPECNDDGSRKENTPDPGPATAQDRGQAMTAKAGHQGNDKPSCQNAQISPTVNDHRGGA